jgi:hypothetical protein
MPMAFTKNGLWESTVKRFPNAIAGWRKGYGTVVIAQIELKQGTKGVYASAIDMALMSVTADSFRWNRAMNGRLPTSWSSRAAPS